jgi:Fe-S cluster assembly ATP-binding protein
MLKIKNVSAIVDTQEVLNDINIEINSGEIHAIMGPRYSGKSTLAHLIQGNPYITVTSGSVMYKNKNISKLAAHKRSKLGIFTSFQFPPEIDGLTNLQLLKALFVARNGKEFAPELEKAYREVVITIGLDSRFPDDPVNTSARTPEDAKKGEILQMIMLQPDLAILDEIDLDLSDDALEHVVAIIKSYLEIPDKSLIVITHNKNLLDKLNPNYVHVLVDGEIRATGTTELYKRIIEDGYPQLS